MQRLFTLVFPLLILVTSSISRGDEAIIHRAARISLGAPMLLGKPFANTGSTGTSFSGIYEFIFSPGFTLGVNLSYRWFYGEQSLHQLGYGLMLKHYLFTSRSAEWALHPFLEYGLLLNVSRLKGVQGSGTSHDTRLTAGTDFNLAELPLFFTASYHFSRLQYFSTGTSNLDYFEAELGWRYHW